MRDSEVLKNYRVAVLEIGLLERQIERLGGVGGPDGYGQYSLDRVAKGTNHREAAAMQRYDGLTGILERKRDALRQMTQRFEALLDMPMPIRLRAIIRSYYALGMTDEAIADALNMSARRVNSLRNEYIKGLDQAEKACCG